LIIERSAKGGNGVKGMKTGKKTPFGEETPSFVKSTPSHAFDDDDGAKYFTCGANESCCEVQPEAG